MPEVITTQKILAEAFTERLVYKGKHRMWQIWEDKDGFMVSNRGLIRPAESNPEARKVVGTIYPNLLAALDNVALAETFDNGENEE